MAQMMVSSERALSLLSAHGTVRPQTPNEWNGTVRLSTTIQHYYRDIGPVDVTIEAPGNPWFLPSLSGLWEYQAGYRWDSFTGERVRDWHDDWIVVASDGGSALIASASRGIVSHALHGTGSWSGIELFPDLASMVAALAILGSVILEAGDDLFDQDCELQPEWRTRAHQLLIAELGVASDAGAILAALGW